jgi:hypothetical protein
VRDELIVVVVQEFDGLYGSGVGLSIYTVDPRVLFD